MAGLRNICTESGAQNFNNLNMLAERLELHYVQNNERQCPILNIKERSKSLKGYLLRDFSNYLKNHHECASQCMEWCLSDKPQCGDNHINSCLNCNERWQVVSIEVIDLIASKDCRPKLAKLKTVT